MGKNLYQKLAEYQGDMPWGSVLDAGTGLSSLDWLCKLPSDSWTGVTASKQMADKLAGTVARYARPQDRLVIGNWLDETLLQGECFDTVIADYLLGAIEGFAPYWQHRLFARLQPLVRKRLYLVGLEPYVSHVPDDAGGQLICEIGRLRDACLLLAGERPYREYPLSWVMDFLPLSGFKILNVERIPIHYGEYFINSQLDMCHRTIGKFPGWEFRFALLKQISELRQRAIALMEKEGGLFHGHDYIVCAEPENVPPLFATGSVKFHDRQVVNNILPQPPYCR
jgi:hypothetical protein